MAATQVQSKVVSMRSSVFQRGSHKNDPPRWAFVPSWRFSLFCVSAGQGDSSPRLLLPDEKERKSRRYPNPNEFIHDVYQPKAVRQEQLGCMECDMLSMRTEHKQERGEMERESERGSVSVRYVLKYIPITLKQINANEEKGHGWI